MLVYNNTDFLGEEKVPFGEGDNTVIIRAPRRWQHSLDTRPVLRRLSTCPNLSLRKVVALVANSVAGFFHP
jgi:hypothetical protein